MKKLFFLLILVVFTYVVSFSALRVYPLVMKVSGNPGETVKASFKLSNTSDKILNATVTIMDFYVNSNGNYITGVLKREYKNSCRNWINISSNTLVLSQNEKTDFPIFIKIPNYASGEYFAGINFAYTPKEQPRGMFKVVMNLFCIIILDIKNSPHLYTAQFKPIKIYNTKLDKLPKNFPMSLKNYPYVFKLDYTNKGNVVIGLQGQVRIVSDTLHKLIGVANLNREDTICFPDITRTVWIPFERLMPNGEYRALLSADLGDHHMTSHVFKFKITGASLSQAPALKLDTSEIDIPLERLNTYLGKNFKIESLDYRKINVSAQLTGLIQTKDGTLVSAPLDKEIFGNLRIYPSRFSVYPYSQREARIAGRAPSIMPSAGQHYALLKLTASVDKGKEPKVLEIPIVMNVGKLTKSLSLNNLETTSVGTSTKVSIDVVNNGNSYVDYSGQVFVTNEEGKSALIQPIAMKGGRIYAGFTVSPSVVIPVKLKKGYTVRVVVKYMIGKGANGGPIYQTVSKEMTVR